MRQFFTLIVIASLVIGIQLSLRYFRNRRLKRWLDRGMKAYQSNQYEESLKAFNKCVRMAPHWLYGRTFRAISLAKCGRKEEALQEIHLVEELQPREEETWMLINMFYTLCMPDREEYLLDSARALGKINPAAAATLLKTPAFKRLKHLDRFDQIRQEIHEQLEADTEKRNMP